MTESITRRKPGRPTGSSRLNKSDALLCQLVAEKVLQNPTLSDRAAIVQVIGSQDAAGVRRLQGKFHRGEMVAAAKARADAAEQARQASVHRNLEAMRLALDVVRDIASKPCGQGLEWIHRKGVSDLLWNMPQFPLKQAVGALQNSGALSFLPLMLNRKEK